MLPPDISISSVADSLKPQFKAAIFGSARTSVCLFLVFAVFGSTIEIKAGDDTNAQGWQTYSDAENKFIFKYPKGWEVIDEGFYKTVYGLTIQKTSEKENSDNWIRINSPQFQEEDGNCIDVGNQIICTYSKDADVIEIFKKIAHSFKLN